MSVNLTTYGEIIENHPKSERVSGSRYYQLLLQNDIVERAKIR